MNDKGNPVRGEAHISVGLTWAEWRVVQNTRLYLGAQRTQGGYSMSDFLLAVCVPILNEALMDPDVPDWVHEEWAASLSAMENQPPRKKTYTPVGAWVAKRRGSE